MVSVVKETITVVKPKGLNTTELMKSASSILGISSEKTMKAAECLYMRGFISYPKTTTTSYDPKFDFEQILKDHFKCSEFGMYCLCLLKKGFENPSFQKGLGI